MYNANYSNVFHDEIAEKFNEAQKLLITLKRSRNPETVRILKNIEVNNLNDIKYILYNFDRNSSNYNPIISVKNTRKNYEKLLQILYRIEKLARNRHFKLVA